MAKFNALLNLRLKQKNSDKNKMTALAERSSSGNLSSFSGVFKLSKLTDNEKDTIESILNNFRENEEYNVENDLASLMTITSEVKAITNQAIILHGERIKRAQEILKAYKEGAFTAWLIATYGNRQTPYNFLQYYEFYSKMPQDLHPIIDQMPRQAVYSLASREGSQEKKLEIIQNYNGQAKQELLTLIRTVFPLAETDKRIPNYASRVLSLLKRANALSEDPSFVLTEKQKKQMQYFIDLLESKI
ncbi:MAG: hypothetical protein COT84_00170 [Chlamydiae bacterium CG10_big_fil_rev_8_21_14_0_10_35_9]|nr:MAG: hypothetical protein COT84_00170 [Chlamydiae bacterium CG10_big_fil_rev_8_21_14_0_10_35_9]